MPLINYKKQLSTLRPLSASGYERYIVLGIGRRTTSDNYDLQEEEQMGRQNKPTSESGAAL